MGKTRQCPDCESWDVHEDSDPYEVWIARNNGYGECRHGCSRGYNCEFCGCQPWRQPIVHAVCLHAKNEIDLINLELVLKDAGISHQAIREPWEPWSGQLMAIGITPQPKDAVYKFMRKFPLVK